MVLPYEERPAPPPGPLSGLLASLGLLAVGGLAAWAVFRRPEPVLERGIQSFSTARALHVLDWLTDEPRPVGSEAHDRIRQQLVAEIRATGLAPEIQAGEVHGVALSNVLARLPGRSPRGDAPRGDATGGERPLVLVVCHYDSRDTTPGASDDGAAVAACLQALEILVREPPLRNDLVFLFTDGEELGLLGALLFAEEHPWMASVRGVLNFDAIGNDGPLVLFQVGPASRGWLELYAANAPHPVASSLAPSIYEHLPNDTDFTVFLQRGIPGLNFALVGGGEAYHAPSDTVERIDHGSVQLLGDTVLALARAAGEADLAALAGGDATFFGVLGRWLARYERGATLALLAATLAWLALALVRNSRRRGLGARFLAAGILLAPIVVAASLLALELAFLATEALVPLLPRSFLGAPAPAPSNLESASWTLAGLALLAVAAVTTGFEFLRERESGADAAAAGGFVPWAALLVWLAASDPLAGAELVPAVLLGATPLFLRGRGRGAVAWIAGAGVLVLVAPVLALAFHLLAKEPAQAVFVAAVALPVLCLLVGPFFAAVVHGRLTRLLLALLGVAGLCVGAWMRTPMA
jgi:hypothetical protein